MNLGLANSTSHRSYSHWALVIALAGILAGCKKLPDQALVVFRVEVSASVKGFTRLEFSVDGHKDVAPKAVTNENDDHRTFQFGYYMPGVSGTVTIHCRALDRNGCVLGEGALEVTEVRAGQTTMTDRTLQIAPATSSCSDAAPSPSDAGGSGTGGTQGTDGGPPDAGGMAGDGSSVIVTGKQVDGKACGADGDCQSGHCMDGVCCNEACTGTCKACAATYTGGTDGVCANASAGASSRGLCLNETSTKPCGRDGTCDGTGQCKYVTAGQTCGQATCADAHTFQPEATCDGAGACMTAATMDCGMYSCATTGCAKPCTDATDCTASQYCSNGTCKVKKSLGTMCATAPECGSGFCSPDQVCCDKACTGACTACVKSSTGQTDGTCAPVQLGLKHNSDCEAEPATACGKDGTCDGKGGCHLYASGMSCMPGSCSGSTFTPAKTCDGSGMCTAPGAPIDCGQSACTTAGCTSSCKADTDCGSSGYCDKTSGKCTSKKSNGSPCGAGNECTSSACVDGTCCNTACSGTCVSCLAAKTGAANGMCTFIKAGMPDSRCPASEKSTCGQDGNCDGSGQCEKWPSSTVCAPGTCSTTNYLAARTCSQGTCSPAAQTACGAAVCDPASGCRTTCTSNSDCTGNNYCDSGTKKCAPLKGNGTSCGTDGKQCMSGLCVDGVCCNAKCDGQCQSCSTGTCANVKTARTPCGGTAPCAGSCDGTGPGCAFPGSSTSCGPTGCMNSMTANAPGMCNGGGTCSGAMPKACTGGQTCTGNGPCNCPSSAPMMCSGSCVATNTNDHCGGCSGCPSGKTCSPQSKCLLVAGQACTAGSECASGTCPTFYFDKDKDGSGSSATSIRQCSGGSPPAGYVTNADDCCDTDVTAFPGQANFFYVANKCGSFDYNCNGSADRMQNQIGPSNCGEVTRTCALNSDSTSCIATCTTTNPTGNPMCVGACIVYSLPACGTPISIESNSCSAPTGTGHGDLFCVSTSNGGPTADNQACH
jgi:hypothetical protein